MWAVERDKRLARIRELTELITPAPWKADIATNSGKNWQLASLGASCEDEQEYIVTTDRIPVSQMDGDAKYDAEFIALVRNNIDWILENLK